MGKKKEAKRRRKEFSKNVRKALKAQEKVAKKTGVVSESDRNLPKFLREQ